MRVAHRPPSFVIYFTYMEHPPTSNYEVKKHPSDPAQVEVVIKNSNARAFFVYDPKTKGITRTGILIDATSIDIPEEQFVGPGPLKNAEARALKHFAENPIVEKPTAPLGSQYELRLDDQTLH